MIFKICHTISVETPLSLDEGGAVKAKNGRLHENNLRGSLRK